jgi:cyclopropane fatty-acyl-phospholipid synthase-like methyltransferase
MNPNKALWEKGDFTRIAESMRESGETLVKSFGIRKGLKVLDLGCGDGTTALPAARLGADVLGVDIAKNLVDAGNRRAVEEGLTNCKFQEGDATNLHEIADHSFDLVVSIFGAMSHQSRLTLRRRWRESPGTEGESSWETGFQMIQHWWRKS